MANISQKWLEVLVPFSYNYSKKFSGSEISKKIGIPQRSVSRHLLSLVNKNVLRFETRGKNKFYYLDLEDKRTKIVINLIESYKAFKFSLKTKMWKDLRQLTEFGTVILFGSQVKGYSSKSSDIDVVIFAKKSEKLNKTLRNLDNVQAHVISFEKFEKLVFERDTLAMEILEAHIVFGDVSRIVNLFWRHYNGKR